MLIVPSAMLNSGNQGRQRWRSSGGETGQQQLLHEVPSHCTREYINQAAAHKANSCHLLAIRLHQATSERRLLAAAHRVPDVRPAPSTSLPSRIT